MNSHIQSRPSNMALAFINAACVVLPKAKAKKPSETWVARRVAENADRGIGMVKERGLNAHLSFRTSEKLKALDIL